MPRFDRKRFEALILYVAWRTKDDARFGRIKLAKTLFYSDFDVYVDSGNALTGATYIRLPQGPYPRELDDAEQALKTRGLVLLDHDKDQYEEKRMIPIGDPPKLDDLFEHWQLSTVDGWIEKISRATAKQTSELSHGPAWKLAAETGVEIPYSAAFLPRERPMAQDAQRAIQLGRKEGWLTDDGWIWEREAAESK